MSYHIFPSKGVGSLMGERDRERHIGTMESRRKRGKEGEDEGR